MQMNFNETSALFSSFSLPLPAGDAGSVCSGQQPRRSDAAEAGGADGPQSESHTGPNVPLLNWPNPVHTYLNSSYSAAAHLYLH